MYKIERKFSIAIGHSLSKHLGKCKNIHGHGIIIYVGVKSNELDEHDMVMDFSDLKLLCNKHIDAWDHSLMLNKVEEDTINFMTNKEKTVIIFNTDPTAEAICKILYKRIEFDLLEEKYEGIKMDYVSIFENENSKATYEE